MSTLVVQIPQRHRLGVRDTGNADPVGNPGAEYNYALSPDGFALQTYGTCAVALLPKAATAVAVLADADVSWHRITLPKAPAARLHSALAGVMEEALLEDTGNLHIAVAPGGTAGELTWVAVVDRAWLTAELTALEKAHVFIDRVVPLSWPDEPPSGHFAELSEGAQGATLCWAHIDGVVQIALQGSLARSLLPNPLPEGARWSATPATASAAERWLNTPITVMDWPQRSVQAARSLWNLRQFTLARKSRGTRALRDVWRQFLKPAWRPLRLGVGALIVVQILGLNLWAVRQRSEIVSKQRAMESVLRTAHPNIGGVLDATQQMQRETDTLRSAAGKPGDVDLEPMLFAAASAWPPDRPPVDKLRFEIGKLSLTATGWNPQQIEQFRVQLRPSGWQVDATGELVILSKLPAGGGRTP